MVLAVAIIGSIYVRIATPLESAGVGFVVGMLMTFALGRLDFAKLRVAVHESLKETLINSTVTANCCVMRCSKCSHIFEYAALSALLLLALYSPQRITQSLLKTTAMIFIIVAGAKVFSSAITLYLTLQSISGFVTENITSPTAFILAVGLVLLIIGFFLEALSMMLIMVPVLLPALEIMDIDPIWFGIFFAVLIETALITPPACLNLFVIQAIGEARLWEVMRGAIPFALIMLATEVLLWFWQSLVVYIPYKSF